MIDKIHLKGVKFGHMKVGVKCRDHFVQRSVLTAHGSREDSIRVNGLTPCYYAYSWCCWTVRIVWPARGPYLNFDFFPRFEVKRYPRIPAATPRSIPTTRTTAPAIQSTRTLDRGSAPRTRPPRLLAILTASTSTTPTKRELR